MKREDIAVEIDSLFFFIFRFLFVEELCGSHLARKERNRILPVFRGSL